LDRIKVHRRTKRADYRKNKDKEMREKGNARKEEINQ
jgi:hypothetical protein